MIKTTWDNLLMLKEARGRANQSPAELADVIQHLEERFNELHGEEAQAGKAS